jgi:galactitol-specific phosphotransferase system IIB component
MNIEKYISDLLYRYQCVTIPGFGAFLTEFKSAQINQASNVMSPPKKSLSFNYHLQNNDGLLANHIALEEKVSYSEAVVMIKSKVEYWLLKLEFGETLNLENIGEIVKNSEGNLMFVPSNNVNYNTDSFGLTDIVTPDVTREEEAVIHATEKTDNPVVEQTVKVAAIETPQKTAVEKLFETKPTATPLNTTEHKNVTPTKKKSKVGAITSIAAVLVFALGGVYGYKIYNDKIVDELTLVLQKDAQNQVEKKIQEATFVMSNPTEGIEVKVNNTVTPTEITDNTTNLPYHIIAGSFKSEENATNKTEQLKKQGYEYASIVGKNPYQLYMVAYKSFSDYNAAINELKNIQENDNQEAWIYTK